MAADNEVRLLSRAVRDRSIKPLLDRGIKDDWFVTEDSRAVWRFVRQHFTKYGEVPTPVTVKDNFPTYRLLHVDDNVEYLLDQLVAVRRRAAAIEMIQDAALLLERNEHDAALTTLGNQLSLIGSEGLVASTEWDLAENPMQRIEDYFALKNRGDGLLGIPTGFQTLDLATAGLQGGQLVCFIAPAKTGKSMVALQTAINVHTQGHVPMFQSFEMSNSEQQSRHDAMRAGIAHSRLVRGRLEPDEETRYRRMLREMESMHRFVLTDSSSGITVSALAAKITEVQPDVIFVDGAYLMQDDNGESGTPAALTNITRSLKRLAQRLDKPIVITTQVLTWKMKGARITADAIGWSSSFVQDSDVIIGIERPIAEVERDDSRILRIVASRNCGPAETILDWDWEHGRFREAEAIDEDDL